MAINSTPLDQLKSFLNQLFQFDSQDLDFGVYKILHYKKKEIANFIDQLLVDKVKAELQTLSADEARQVQELIVEFEKDDIIKGWLEADESEKKTLEKFGKDKINHYQELQAKATESSVSVETENQIYNHLTLFFSRYYDKGDFISKRRFGKNEKYVVPYNGEETHFHWANQDQYYIKSSETFNHYAFKVQTADSNLVVNFKLHNAQLEQGNVKAEETNFFMLSDKSPEIKEKDDSDLQFVLANKQPDVNEKEITIYFEYRPLGDDEKKKVKGNSKQDTLDEIAFDFLKKEFGTNPIFANLWKEQEGKPLLLKKLQHYTRKNKHDFFIHKNLKGFLERELDYYIKSELVNVDDLYVTDIDSHFDRLKHNLKTIKVFKSIADAIIDFVSQIEDFQKKLWEKKKFVLSTEWVITIDRLVEYVGEETAKPILEEAINNEKQVNEWKELFGVTDIGKEGERRRLPIDTKHFSTDFKYNLLSVVSDGRDIEAASNGLVVESDNYQGLNLIRDKFSQKINTIYIDPPYNSGGNDFLYKDKFRNSSWLTMIADRMPIARDLMAQDGLFFTSIDDKDPKNKVTHRLSTLLEAEFGPENYIENVIWVKNTTHNDAKTFSHNHEYIQAYTKDKNAAIQEHETFRRAKPGYVEVKELIQKLNKDYPTLDKISEELRILYREQEKNYKAEVEALGLEWNKETKRNNPWKGIRSYKYAEYRDASGKWVTQKDAKKKKANIHVYASADASWPNSSTLTKDHKDDNSPEFRFYKPQHPVTGKPCPHPSRGWLWSYESERKAMSFKKMNDQHMIHFGEDENTVPRLKKHLNTVTTDVSKSVISDFTDGEKELANIVGVRGTFPNPKPTTVVRNLLALSSKKTGYILDFFAGSGTTAQSTFQLNDVAERSMSFIIQDMAQNVHRTILPRIKKIAYTFDWKDGKPKDGSMNGLGVFFKYQRLEQYEEALENIAFNASEDAVQKALEFEQYIPKYFLEFETKGSQSLVNTAAMQNPWDYKLKVWDGFTYDTEQAVDLVETFNYLIGLHMQKCITKEVNGKKYQFIYGHNNANKSILVVWRSVKDWSVDDFKADAAALKSELKGFEYDLLYINDQAHIEGYQPIEEVFKNKMLS
ncbi:DNA methyltransferase [Phaeocystidibacter luteus]|uniref:site-specific DNA-methyltransferase (adenine-specific) n=1 Tax=Phaeocystidibacter luteus TaxID=911197 RepID=A0A6N6RFU0_9FLAO|nr:DNA methyltransferase [Phaeocystidibacter luteus]KAB2807666.1 site-specific DNA-methyltransferase [Phaeocystidibacter luteus]